jgi:Protein of unknown function DUF262/Protein of unknown function (DUF1524)/Restriction Enzyme Adenine Methylase Associated
MNADETLLRVLLHGTTHYMVPLFQRTYSWDKNDWETLWIDTLETYDADAESRHFMGSIVTKSLASTPEGVSRFLLIDGQQRLTTLTLLLAALRDAARPANAKLADKLHELYLTNQYASGLDKYKVLPTQADRASYFGIVDGDATAHASTQVHRAYQYFRSQLAKRAPDGQALDLVRLERVLLNGFEVVSITLGEHDNEYRIFESLNAKGAPLTQADLLRNYLFMRIPIGAQDEVYRRVWFPLQTSLGHEIDNFFRYEYLSDGAFIREGDVYQGWKKILDRLSPEELRARMDVFARDGGFYLRIVSPAHEPHPAIAAQFRRLNRWGGQTMYPFLLNVYRWYDRGEVDAAGVVAITQMIESFLVRRLFADVPTNALNRLFLRLAQQLPPGHNRVDGTHLALSDPGRRWPRDDEFRAGILRYPLYLDSRPDQRRMILETFEASYAHKEPPSFAGASIEHVMPQSLTAEWREALGPGVEDVHRRLLHVLGNLTLSAYNAELGNETFDRKRQRFATSNFELNKELAVEPAWAGAHVEARGRRLAARAIRLWPAPVDADLMPELAVPGDAAPPRQVGTESGQMAHGLRNGDAADWLGTDRQGHRNNKSRTAPGAATRGRPTGQERPPLRRAEGGRPKAVHNVSLRDLIAWSVLHPPFEIRHTLRGRLLVARIIEDGTVVWNGRKFDTLSSAARAACASVTGQETELNGWAFWTFVDADERYRPLSTLRDRYYGRKASESE